MNQSFNEELMFNFFSKGFADYLSKNLGHEIEPVTIEEEHKRFEQSIYEFGFSINKGEIRYFKPDDAVVMIDGKKCLIKKSFKKVPRELKEVLINHYSRELNISQKQLKNYMRKYINSKR